MNREGERLGKDEAIQHKQKNKKRTRSELFPPGK